MSETDIPAGGRWGGELKEHLQESDTGVLCITRENCEAPWMLFEAGALARSLAPTLVCPYLIDVASSDLPSGPLLQFQAKEAARDDTLDLVLALNAACGSDEEPTSVVTRRFSSFWPSLEEVINTAKAASVSVPPRSFSENISELLELARSSRHNAATNAGGMFLTGPLNHVLARHVASLQIHDALNRTYSLMPRGVSVVAVAPLREGIVLQYEAEKGIEMVFFATPLLESVDMNTIEDEIVPAIFRMLGKRIGKPW